MVYHIVRTGSGYYWKRTNGLMDTSVSYNLYPKVADCIKSAKADAERLQVKPIIIR